MPAKAAPKKNLSALKRDRQAEKRRARNQSARTAVRTAIKKVEASLSTKDKETIGKAFASAVKTISSTASKGVIHRNTASRKISRVARKVHAALTGGAETPAKA